MEVKRSMKIGEFGEGRKDFRAVKDEKYVKKVMDVIGEFNKVGEAPSTRQISNVVNGVQTVADAIKAVDNSLPTNVQDAMLQGILNPLQTKKALQAVFGERNTKCWKLNDEVIARLTAAVKAKQ